MSGNIMSFLIGFICPIGSLVALNLWIKQCPSTHHYENVHNTPNAMVDDLLQFAIHEPEPNKLLKKGYNSLNNKWTTIQLVRTRPHLNEWEREKERDHTKCGHNWPNTQRHSFMLRIGRNLSHQCRWNVGEIVNLVFWKVFFPTLTRTTQIPLYTLDIELIDWF